MRLPPRLRPALLALAAATLVTVLAGCSGIGGVGAGAGVPSPDDWTTRPAPLASPNARPAAAGTPIRVVSARHRALRATLGIQVYWNSTGTRAQMEADATRIFNYVVGLGANSVGINFFFYTNGVDPTRVYGVSGTTPSPATIAMVVANAREHGLRVTVRPLLNEDNIKIVGNNWRGSIQPPSVDAWFSSYYRFLGPYLEAAQRSRANAFNIGTELDSLAPDKQIWTLFEKAVAKIFTGQQIYAVNYGRWQTDPSYEPVPYAAVDAYPELGEGNDATVSQLTAAWVSWLHSQPQRVLDHTVLQEVGIAAVAGAYQLPARAYPQGTRLDISVQRNWFVSACDAAKKAHLAGIYFYDVNSTDQPSDPHVVAKYAPGSFIDRSDGVIKACFASGWS